MPRSVLMSCSLKARRWKILRKLRRITGALPIGRKKPARSSSLST